MSIFRYTYVYDCIGKFCILHIYIYVPEYIHMLLYTLAHVCILGYMPVCICMQTKMYAQLLNILVYVERVFLHVCTHAYVYVCTIFTCINIYVHVCTYIHIYKYIYIHTCIHTYLHAYIHTCRDTYICVKGFPGGSCGAGIGTGEASLPGRSVPLTLPGR